MNSSQPLHITALQLAPRVADFNYNIELLCAALAKLPANAVAISSELYLCGYSPEDLLLRAEFIDACNQALDALCARLASCAPQQTLLIGAPARVAGKLYNAIYQIHAGKLELVYKKSQLPNYGVFDEKRYFSAANQPAVINCQGYALGLLICEDLWSPSAAGNCQQAGAELLISINASPYSHDKLAARQRLLAARASELQLPIIYINQVGAQDDLVFDGASMAVAADGSELFSGAQFVAECASFAFAAGELSLLTPPAKPPSALAGSTAGFSNARLWADYQALCLGLQTYVHASGFSKVLLGLSGGVDSALVLALAVDALGAANVQAVMLPSRYSAEISLLDAAKVAANFKVDYRELPIDAGVALLSAELKAVDMAIDGISAENIQARLRGLLLMAISNQSGAMLLTTGNKSEYAVGYATLYGDMCGGFAPLKDVYKTEVFALCKWRNRHGELIPQRIIERAPSAELAAGQTDQDSLPEYAVLDAILQAYLEAGESRASLLTRFAAAEVDNCLRRLWQNEFKRRQSAIGVRISNMAFARERRYPLSAKFDY